MLARTLFQSSSTDKRFPFSFARRAARTSSSGRWAKWGSGSRSANSMYEADTVAAWPSANWKVAESARVELWRRRPSGLTGRHNSTDKHMGTHISTHAHMRTQISTHAHMHTQISTHAHMRTHISTHVHADRHTYAHK